MRRDDCLKWALSWALNWAMTVAFLSRENRSRPLAADAGISSLLAAPAPSSRGGTAALLAVFIYALLLGCGGVARPLPPPPAPSNVERGIGLYRAGRWDEAASVLELATREQPRQGRAWTYLGLARLELQRANEARAAFERALEIDDDNAEAHYGLGVAYGYQGRLDASIEALERAVQLQPNHAKAHYQLGLAFNQKKRIDRAILHLERFLELTPDAPEAPRVRQLLKQLR